MPFLRRRGNMASETDIRRHTFGLSSSKPRQLPPVLLSAIDTETMSNSDAVSANDGGDDVGDAVIQDSPHSHEEMSDRDDDSPFPARPDSPPVQEETHRHRRFSALRFRNASDPQLSLKARKQAEKPPPLPAPREFRPSAPSSHSRHLLS